MVLRKNECTVNEYVSVYCKQCSKRLDVTSRNILSLLSKLTATMNSMTAEDIAYRPRLRALSSKL